MLKKLFLLGLVLVMGLTACTKVPPGYVGIKAYSVGTEQGVDHEVVGPGRYFSSPNSEYFLYPVFQQTYVYTRSKDEGNVIDESFTFQTREGLEIGADIGVSFHVDLNKVSVLFQKYRNGIHEIIASPVRGVIRDAFNMEASKVDVEYAYGEGKSKLIDSVQMYVQAYFKPLGIIIDKVYLVGSFRLPQTVVNALNSKIEAKQIAAQTQNEVAQAEAEANKQIAKARGDSSSMVIRALGEAQAMEAKNKKITALLVEFEKMKKWDGKLPQVTGGSTPMVSLK